MTSFQIFFKPFFFFVDVGAAGATGSGEATVRGQDWDTRRVGVLLLMSTAEGCAAKYCCSCCKARLYVKNICQGCDSTGNSNTYCMSIMLPVGATLSRLCQALLKFLKPKKRDRRGEAAEPMLCTSENDACD